MHPPPSLTDSPILATAVVPWTESLEFDAERFAAQVRSIARTLTRHIYIFGTAGEGHAVTDAQFEQISTCFFRTAVNNAVTPMLGVISLSLGTMLERIALGRRLGYREFQVSLPCWGALNDAEVDAFFAETCGRFPDCRFLHYNLMRSRRLLTADDYARQLSLHPNLMAVKMSTEDAGVLAGLMALAPRLRCYFTEFGFAAARPSGSCGLLASLSTVHPARAVEFACGDAAERSRLVPGLRAMGATLQELARGKFHIDSAYDKLLFRCVDPDFPLRLLPPYRGASEEDARRFIAQLPESWKN